MMPFKEFNSSGPLFHTLDHLGCPACEKARAMTLTRIAPGMTFAEASKLWLESRTFSLNPRVQSARFIKRSTEDSYRAYVDSLNLFFARTILKDIHLGMFRMYQEARVAGDPPFVRFRRPQDAKERRVRGVVLPARGKTPCPASPKKCNQELCVLKMILTRAGCWNGELVEYEPFREEESDMQRALSPDEQRRWLDVALARDRWWLVYWYSVLAFETSMSTNEIRALRVGDVNLYHEILNIPPAGGKNKYRVRTVPLISAEVKWACEQLLARARDLGSAAPQHFLFPWREKRAPYDPTRPMTESGIKSLWQEVRLASGLTWFRPYDTRHTAITRWAEAGIAPETIRSMAGHVSERMMRHYTHISEMAQRRALAKMTPRIGPASERAPFYVARRQ